MKIQRTKFKHTTPRSQTELSSLSLELGGDFRRLIITVARIIDKIFGLLYLGKSSYVPV